MTIKTKEYEVLRVYEKLIEKNPEGNELIKKRYQELLMKYREKGVRRIGKSNES